MPELSPRDTNVYFQEQNTCDMVANAFIAAGAEVFNTYGPALSNAQLICQYGFALDGNEHDVVSWDETELREFVSPDAWDKQQSYVAELRERWKEYTAWESSDLVFNIDRSASLAGPRTYLVNSDGSISHDFWAWGAATVLAEAHNRTSADVVPAAVRLAEEQLRLEARLEVEVDMVEDHDAEDVATREPPESASLALLLRLYDLIGTIIMARQTRLSCGKTPGELGSLLDVRPSYLWHRIATHESPSQELPLSYSRTRMAVTQVVGELSLIQACISKLGALADTAPVSS
jgi:SET domain-containing protein 6